MMKSLLAQRKLFIVTLSSITVLLLLFIMLQSYQSGPAKNKTTVTGAPFNNNKTCSDCHGGGNFGGTIKTELLDNSSKVVTAYAPGQAYTFRITMSKTTGSPKYGFQTTSALSTGNTNVNNWGTLPANTHNSVVSSRNYVEQSASLASGTISIPWTAPAKGSGSVVFYTAGNIVNGNGSTSGDQPVNTSVTITEGGALPITLLYFKGSLQNNVAMLTWATATEINNKSFTVQKSADGITYNSIATVAAYGGSTGHTYSYNDASFKNAAYYRLAQTDADGKTTYFNIVNLKNASAVSYDITLYYHAGTPYAMFYNGSKQQKADISYFDIQGRLLYHGSQTANEGNNIWQLPVTTSGIVIVSVVTEDGIRTSRKMSIIR